MANMPTLRDILNDTPGNAVDVEWNFNNLESHIDNELIARDGSVAMAAPLTLVSAPPTLAGHAVRKDYVDSQLAALVDLLIPIGTILPYGGDTIPNANFAFCRHQLVSKTAYPVLYSRFKSLHGTETATDFYLPDGEGRTMTGVSTLAADAIFNTVGKIGGKRDSELLAHAHTVPIHGHGMTGGVGPMDRSIDHLHGPGTLAGGAGTTTNGEHGHNFGNGSEIFFNGVAGYGGYGSGGLRLATFLHDGAHSHTFDVGMSRGATAPADRSLDHLHSNTLAVSNQPAFDTTPNGAGTTYTDKNLPPYLAVNYIVRLI